MKEAENIIETLPGGISFEMVFVKGGSFMMGDQADAASSIDLPVHEVRLNNFYIAKYLVTQALWKAVLGLDNSPSKFKGGNRPVERVSWNEVQEFIKELNKISTRSYRLLTESEWEYAARGGEKSEGYEYAGSNKLKDIAWYNKNSYGETKPVGLKYPNELGIYDMSGNVLEWCEDDYHANYHGAPDDGSAWVDNPKRDSDRIIRGGSWGNNLRNCRVSYRDYSAPLSRTSKLGFRLGLSPQ